MSRGEKKLKCGQGEDQTEKPREGRPVCDRKCKEKTNWRLAVNVSAGLHSGEWGGGKHARFAKNGEARASEGAGERDPRGARVRAAGSGCARERPYENRGPATTGRRTGGTGKQTSTRDKVALEPQALDKDTAQGGMDGRRNGRDRNRA